MRIMFKYFYSIRLVRRMIYGFFRMDTSYTHNSHIDRSKLNFDSIMPNASLKKEVFG